MEEIKYDPTDPALVRGTYGNVIGFATHWNPHGLGECIVQFFDGSADSCMFGELDFANGSDKAREFLNSKER